MRTALLTEPHNLNWLRKNRQGQNGRTVKNYLFYMDKNRAQRKIKNRQGIKPNLKFFS